MKRIALFLFMIIGFGITLCGCDMGSIGGTQGGGEGEGEGTEPEVTTYKVSFYDGKKIIEEIKVEPGKEISFPEAPEKEGKYFVYWSLDGKEFKLTLMPKKDLVLKAEYKDGYTYKFVDFDGTVIASGAGEANSEVPVPKNPERPDADGVSYTFTGWDKEVAPLTENVVYTATYSSQKVNYLTYVVNGGNFKYYSYDDVVKELLYDYNKCYKTSYTTATMPTGAWELINFHSFYFNGDNATKWQWLLEYLGEVGSGVNRQACKALANSNSVANFESKNENYKYSVSYELRAFIKGGQISSNGSYPTNDYSTYDLQNGFWDIYQEVVEQDLVKKITSTAKMFLPKLYKLNYEFVGWYDNPEFEGDAITSLSVDKNITVYAKFKPLEPVTEIVIENKIEELVKFGTHALTWKVNPTEVKNKQLRFKSSDTKVLTVSQTGVLTAISEGTATITITSVLTPSVFVTFEVEVYSPDHFAISYETESYVTVGNNITLNAEYIKRDGSQGVISWKSLNENIATVNNGVVTAVSEGLATIRAYVDGDETNYQDFVVTVVSESVSAALQQVISSHNSNIFVEYQLGIGAGTPSYYMDIIGSVSQIMYNEEFVTNDKYYADQQRNNQNHGGLIESHEFVTVHYTGNMSATADGAANASYFANETSTSIHYTTGNDGIYYILDEKYVGHHAGDGTSVTFRWSPTGVKVAADDPVKPVWDISENSKFMINGKETTISVPTGSTAATQKVTDKRWINDMGLAYKVVDGEYYMGTTWWCYSQISEGRICNKGGNNNSIGIESCVNKGSDLWYTWNKTAKLVADIMIRNNLDITRVVGHHFYSAKDCPQPMLENDLELWYEFLEMVEGEHALMTTFKDYSFNFEVVEGEGTVTNLGRVRQPLYSEVLTYKVTITDASGNVEEITLASAVEGKYNK